MRASTNALVMFAALTVIGAQSADPPLSDTRLTVHTLLREDLFAGFLDNNMARLSRGERNIEALLSERPSEKANLLAWKAGAAVYRAVLAHESSKDDEFQRYWQAATESFAEAARLESGDDGVVAITGGTLVLFADRLPADQRAGAWSQVHDAYAALWKEQGSAIETLPVHFSGEVLAGLAQSAHRLGRTEEATQYVERILGLLPGTPYERAAKEWKADPASAARTTLTCKTCHNPGRLSARLAALGK